VRSSKYGKVVLSAAFFPNKSLTRGRGRKSRTPAERIGLPTSYIARKQVRETQRGARYARQRARNARVAAALSRWVIALSISSHTPAAAPLKPDTRSQALVRMLQN
jgi:hypothetical protein